MNNNEDPVNEDAQIDELTEVSAREALTVIDERQRQSRASLFPGPAPILAAWGCTYLVGFSAFWLSVHGNVVPTWVAVLILAGLGTAASAVSLARTTRLGRGVKGPSRRSAIAYSWCWPVGLVAVLAFDLGLTRHGLPESTLSLLWPGSFLLVVAVLFLCGGVLFSDRSQFGLGVLSSAVAAASTFAGWPGNYAVLALAGGGGLLVSSAFQFFSGRSSDLVGDES
jgi:hypothetical protein